MKLEKTWRWYGPEDLVPLSHIRQAGATGVVTALHHVANGAVWSIEEIEIRKREIEKAQLTWSVVESVPIHEDIKRRSGNFQLWIDNYKNTLQNLAQCGISIVTYNFMPVVDWSRTDLAFELPNGSKALRFERAVFDAFELFILERPGAESEISEKRKEAARERYDQMSQGEKEKITDYIIAGLPGKTTEGSQTLREFRELVQTYENITPDILRNNLVVFLKEIVPVAEKIGVKLAIHPDDPPFPLLGLPRVVSTEADALQIIESVNSISNGLCFCTGSYGVLVENDLPEMIRRLGHRINFVHLRSTKRDEHGNFFEANHLEGDVDMYAVMEALVEIQRVQNVSLPMRPDHGHLMLDDLHKKTNPGYSAIGRLKGLAELTGLELGILKGDTEMTFLI